MSDERQRYYEECKENIIDPFSFFALGFGSKRAKMREIVNSGTPAFSDQEEALIGLHDIYSCEGKQNVAQVLLFAAGTVGVVLCAKLSNAYEIAFFIASIAVLCCDIIWAGFRSALEEYYAPKEQGYEQTVDSMNTYSSL